MKKIIFIFILLFSISEANATVYGVIKAINDGYITLSASVPASAISGYDEVEVTVTNTQPVSVDIDFSTFYLVQDNLTQRIGLAYEKSTGRYLLRLLANTTYTLYFKSRCLDHNRDAPDPSRPYAKAFPLSGFSPIITALRNKYSQGYIWNYITDSSSSFSVSWKTIDPRPLYTTVYTTSSLDLGTNAGWSIFYSSYCNCKRIRITTDGITNLSSNLISGSLRLRVWATFSPYTGGTLYGYVVGRARLNPLQPGSAYSSLILKKNYTRPPKGNYYTTITLEEYTTSGWYIRDYVSSTVTSQF